jgi:hypothetical protein
MEDDDLMLETMDEAFTNIASILKDLSSEQKLMRTVAEEQLNSYCQTQPELLLLGLSSLCLDNDNRVKTNALVMLRKVALRMSGEHVLISRLSEQGLLAVQSNLLFALLNKCSFSARLKLCDTVCEIANYLLGMNSF